MAFTDTVLVSLPPGTRVEALPPPVEVTTAFGTYRAAATAEGATLRYHRALRTVAGQFPADQYAAYVAFSEQVARADRQLATLQLAPPPAAPGQ